jgi:hypothetical protein
METLVNRLRTRSDIRKNIKNRRSVQEGKPDRICELLDEAANRIQELELNTVYVVGIVTENSWECSGIYPDEEK